MESSVDILPQNEKKKELLYDSKLFILVMILSVIFIALVYFSFLAFLLNLFWNFYPYVDIINLSFLYVAYFFLFIRNFNILKSL